jgi:ribosomal RNA-processing protein 36
MILSNDNQLLLTPGMDRDSVFSGRNEVLAGKRMKVASRTSSRNSSRHTRRDDESSSTASRDSERETTMPIRPLRNLQAAEASSSSESDTSADESDEEKDGSSHSFSPRLVDANDYDDSKSTSSSSTSSGADDRVAAKVDRHSMPLAERIRLQESRGTKTNNKHRLERKSLALKIATQRLAEMNKASAEPSKNPSSSSSSSVPAKKSKHAPTEASSKRSDFYRRRTTLNESGIGVAIGAHRYKPLDPRVSNLHGHLDVGQFEHNFDFIKEIREKEMTDLRKRIAARKLGGRKGQKKRRELGLTHSDDASTLESDKTELKRLLQENADLKRNQIERAAKQTVKKSLQQQVAEGASGVYFPKKRDLKRMHLEAKFEEIRKRGGDGAVEKALAKRRKKNKTRDAGKLGGRIAGLA